jgi:hypothetical protein
MSLHRDQSTVEEDASLGRAGLGPDWAQAHPLWNAEVLLILQHHQTAIAKDEATGGASAGRAQPSAQTQQRMQQTLQYVRALNNYHSQAAVDEAMGSVPNTARRISRRHPSSQLCSLLVARSPFAAPLGPCCNDLMYQIISSSRTGGAPVGGAAKPFWQGRTRPTMFRHKMHFL